MKQLAGILIVAALATGCVSTKTVPVDQQVSMTFKDETIARTSRPKPSFAAQTPATAIFGAIGAVTSISNGNTLINKYDVADPAVQIADSLLKSLAEKRGMLSLAATVKVDADDPAAIVRAATGSNARYVLDVRTVFWMLGYFSTDWTHYQVRHTAQARLIDTQDGKVVAEGFCKRPDANNTGAPTYDELLGRQGFRLKKELATAGDECAATLKRQMLSL